MLLGLLIYWCVDAKFTHYSSMSPSQTIAYISDVGASKLKPLFITGCCVTTVFLDLSFVLDLWLRHRGRLVPNTETKEKVFSWLTIGFAILGTCGLILLSIFDTVRHPRLHDVFLLLFIAGYVLSAIFLCCQYQRLGKRMYISEANKQPPSFPLPSPPSPRGFLSPPGAPLNKLSLIHI